MRPLTLAAIVLLCGGAAATEAMTVQTFLTMAQGLQQRGMLLALASPDYGTLKQVMIGAGHAWRTQIATIQPPVCAPQQATLNSDQVLAMMQAVPAPVRATTDAQATIIAAMNQRYRCH